MAAAAERRRIDENKWLHKVFDKEILRNLVKTFTREPINEDTIEVRIMDWKLPMETTSSIRKIEVTCKTRRVGAAQTFIVKNLAHLDDSNSDLNVFLRDIFSKEVLFVSRILPRLDEALSSAGLKDIDHPVYYHCSDVKNEEVIIMEDLSKEYFPITHPRSMDQDHLDLLISNLARLHASSIILEKQGKRKLEEVFPEIIDKWNTEDPKENQFIRDILAGQTVGLINYLKTLPGDWEKATNWLTSNAIDSFRVRGLSFPRGQMNTITHGDLWSNNILFSYDPSGVPDSIKFIDFQICRKGSPITDIMYFFFTSLSAERRRAITSTYLNNYHEGLKRNLKKAGITWDIADSAITEEYNSRSGNGLYSVLSIYPVIYKKEGENTGERESLEELCNRVPAAKENLLAVLEDVSSMGLFDKDVDMENNISHV